MDMCTLLIWRATDRRNYTDVCQELRDSLNNLLLDFVPSPITLLRLLTDTRAVLSGELAICYLLRDASIFAQTLDIYVGSVWFDTFIDTFCVSRELSGHQLSWSMIERDEEYIATRHVTDSLHISLSTGKTIIVHAASSTSACHAIACSPSSLGTSFITEFSFATAYPRLTFNRRAIVCWDQIAQGSDSELDMYEQLEKSGFSFEEDPVAWPDYSSKQLSLGDFSRLECLRSLYLCPQQGRYFGDEGSMMCFMDTLSVDFSWLKERCIPPYGIMAVWRLPSNVLCDAECHEFDDIIAPGVIATSIMFQDKSFTAVTCHLPIPVKSTYVDTMLHHSGRARSVTL